MCISFDNQTTLFKSDLSFHTPRACIGIAHFAEPLLDSTLSTRRRTVSLATSTEEGEQDQIQTSFVWPECHRRGASGLIKAFHALCHLLPEIGGAPEQLSVLILETVFLFPRLKRIHADLLMAVHCACSPRARQRGLLMATDFLVPGLLLFCC